jgi:hypothetical protein
MKKPLLLLLALITLFPSARAEKKGSWRPATAIELQSALPSRAPVEKERIETELRTASGIINTHGHIVAGVVLITAGYSADGKYSHYLLVQNAIKIEDISLPAGAYVFGWKRVEDGLQVHFYDATTGVERGTTVARQMPSGTRVEAFRIWPPTDRSIMQIGRFMLSYSLTE